MKRLKRWSTWLSVSLWLTGCAAAAPQERAAAAPQERAGAPALGLMGARVVELSHPLSGDIPVYPGGVRPDVKVLGTVEKDGYFISQFTTGEHTGTHVDAPAHFAVGGATVDRIPLDALMGPAAVVDVSARVAAQPDYAVTAEDLVAWERQHGPLGPEHLVLIHTGWSERWPDEQRYRNTDAAGTMHFPGLSVEASALLRARRVRAVGIDTLSTDPGPSATFDQHKDFLGGGGYHIENLKDLSALPPTGAFVVVMPLALKGGSGAPARVLAFLPRARP